METILSEVPIGGNITKWPFWKKIIFRFLCIYFLLHLTPWTWLDNIVPGIDYVTGNYQTLISWIIQKCNHLFFHFESTKIVNNGSGDTTFNWEEVFTYLLIALAGTFLCSLLDRKRANYVNANIWLQIFLRYFLIINCFSYGIIKLYGLQMIFPNQSQLSTPLGDFLPMRFSWMFIGYSTPYQMFSGAMEVLAGMLLLNRKTITLGLFVATSVFLNVLVLNLCYDIPVKLFSIHLVLYCIYLLLNDYKRLFNFFVLNIGVSANSIHSIHFSKKWIRIVRIVLKLVFIIIYVVLPFINTKDRYYSQFKLKETTPIHLGIYDVTVFAINNDTLPYLPSDTTRWKDVIFEKDGLGSVGSTDSLFRQRYRRGYFNFKTDTLLKTISFKKLATDSLNIFEFNYELPDPTTLKLWGNRKKDSYYLVLRKSNRHFKLAEKQFHWISEANR